MRWSLLVAMVLLFALPAPTPAVAQQQGPELTLHSPSEGALIQDDSVTVQFEVSGITLVPSPVPLEQAGQRPDANRPGEGHLHVMLDLQPLVVHTSADPVTFSNVPPGEHQLVVEVVNNDHSPLSPAVVRQVRFRTGPRALPRAGEPPFEAGWGTWLALGAGALSIGALLRRPRVRRR